MKYVEKQKAIQLRKEGYSINSIVEQLGVAKSSVSTWVRLVELTDVQLETLASKPFSSTSIEKRRQSRLLNEKRKRDVAITTASREILEISQRDLWLIGTMLYWAEGGKTQRMVRFSNGDPRMIAIMIRFFLEICKVDKQKLRAHVHIHSHLDHKKAEEYWSEIVNIPLPQFYKTYRRDTPVPNKKDTLPYGVLDIYALDVSLFLKLQGWTRGITGHLIDKDLYPDGKF